MFTNWSSSRTTGYLQYGLPKYLIKLLDVWNIKKKLNSWKILTLELTQI